MLLPSYFTVCKHARHLIPVILIIFDALILIKPQKLTALISMRCCSVEFSSSVVVVSVLTI